MSNGKFTLTRFVHSPMALGKVFALVLFTLVVASIYYVRAAPTPTVSLYQYQQSYSAYNIVGNSYRIIIVADMDHDSKVSDGKWRSVLKSGILKRDQDGFYSISWKEENDVFSKYNEGGRGMELSDLVYFNDKLYSCDDRSGLIFQINLNTHTVYPAHVFSGDEDREKGFKCEWMTVKDDKLYIGSMGKEWSTLTGEHLNNDPMWVKIVSLDGSTRSEDWSDNYMKLNKHVGIDSFQTGYMVHEAVTWEPVSRQWFFLPRRVSIGEGYNADKEGEKGANKALIASENFKTITSTIVGELLPTHGFSSFKFIPHRPDEIVALKTVEFGTLIETYILVFDFKTGKLLMEETLISNTKYEGVEFI